MGAPGSNQDAASDYRSSDFLTLLSMEKGTDYVNSMINDGMFSKAYTDVVTNRQLIAYGSTAVLLAIASVMSTR